MMADEMKVVDAPVSRRNLYPLHDGGNGLADGLPAGLILTSISGPIASSYDPVILNMREIPQIRDVVCYLLYGIPAIFVVLFRICDSI